MEEVGSGSVDPRYFISYRLLSFVMTGWDWRLVRADGLWAIGCHFFINLTFVWASSFFIPFRLRPFLYSFQVWGPLSLNYVCLSIPRPIHFFHLADKRSLHCLLITLSTSLLSKLTFYRSYYLPCLSFSATH